MTARDPATTFIIKLRVPAGIDAIKTIRLALKDLWRRWDLKCISIIEERAE